MKQGLSPVWDLLIRPGWLASKTQGSSNLYILSAAMIRVEPLHPVVLRGCRRSNSGPRVAMERALSMSHLSLRCLYFTHDKGGEAQRRLGFSGDHLSGILTSGLELGVCVSGASASWLCHSGLISPFHHHVFLVERGGQSLVSDGMIHFATSCLGQSRSQETGSNCVYSWGKESMEFVSSKLREV